MKFIGKNIFKCTMSVAVLFSHFSLAQPAKLKGSPLTPFDGARVVVNNAVRVTEGDLSYLANVKVIRIEYDYSQKTVCKFPDEEQYLNHHKEKWSKETYKRFETEWKSLPKEKLEPMFQMYFNRKIAVEGILGKNYADSAEVTMILQVKTEEPDSHPETEQRLPYLHAMCTFLNKEGEFIARIQLTAFGSRDDRPATRITECYAIAGKMVGGTIVKELRKLRK